MHVLCVVSTWKAANFTKSARVQRAWTIAFPRVFMRQRNNLVTLQRRLQVEHLCFFRPQSAPSRQPRSRNGSDFMSDVLQYMIWYIFDFASRVFEQTACWTLLPLLYYKCETKEKRSFKIYCFDYSRTCRVFQIYRRFISTTDTEENSLKVTNLTKLGTTSFTKLNRRHVKY